MNPSKGILVVPSDMPRVSPGTHDWFIRIAAADGAKRIEFENAVAHYVDERLAAVEVFVEGGSHYYVRVKR